ncbi:hypothetical protein [Streptomyces sp. Isolate_45]|uniref:hypothetical protein n=1 Tax=Streptomyces sp. Isolate_45 TaxID=2950111 RepID=UPI002481FB53|nr:hypothetical protein [Streptomyces sp. Isolate_45]MDA5282991.1 hypothetical protein [Streptomyces sp. Isolate_45]
MYDEWVVVAQDCELAWKATLEEACPVLVELRPVLRENPPSDWGIRSQFFRLDSSGAHIDNNLPRLLVHPLTLAAAEHVTCTPNPRRLKTWLGLRYDRPAIPQQYVKLADSLIKKVKAKRTRKIAAEARDILATFETTPMGVSYEIIAVLPSGSPEESRLEILDWISQVALEIPPELGIATRIDARPDTQISLEFIERSFALDASSLSWPVNSPDPTGKFRP